MRENVQNSFQDNLSESSENFRENVKENIRENIRENMPANMKENIEEFKARKTSMEYARLMAGGMCSLIGTILAIYVGGWLMLFIPLKQAFFAFMAGALTKKLIFVTALKCALSLTAGGAIWCGGYIAKQKIIGYEEY